MKYALVLLLVAVLACTKAKTNELPAEAWGTSDYANVGLRIDKPWTPDDYATAAKILQEQTAGHRERLPRFHGAKSGDVFAKIVTDLPDDSSAPIQDRFMAHYTRGEAVNAISKLYMENQFAAPPREWIECMGVAMREGVIFETLSSTFLESFGSDDPSHDTRVNGLATMRKGFANMLLGSLLIVDDKRVPEADRLALLNHLTTALPVLFPAAPADKQKVIRETLAKQVAGFPPGKLHDGLVAAQQALPK